MKQHENHKEINHHQARKCNDQMWNRSKTNHCSVDVTDLKQLVWESKQGQQALIVAIQLSLSFWCWAGFVEQERGEDFFHWVFYKCFSSSNWTTRQLALPSSSVQTCTPQAFLVQMPAPALESLFVNYSCWYLTAIIPGSGLKDCFLIH